MRAAAGTIPKFESPRIGWQISGPPAATAGDDGPLSVVVVKSNERHEDYPLVTLRLMLEQLLSLSSPSHDTVASILVATFSALPQQKIEQLQTVDTLILSNEVQKALQYNGSQLASRQIKNAVGDDRWMESIARAITGGLEAVTKNGRERIRPVLGHFIDNAEEAANAVFASGSF
ncbi:uncharacterized protein PgNI_12014 [Pyricularia grisea]|uniref:Uncharacterized protein n=1 Tax=Pyricularia grisea TaxID=148305 RepID=A0A6P8AQM0_PYRGI|nr:uncharacterized protein PgNI_12014 [Pyricularia grisea]TLD04344.1 hypothetical protein PgNI_12014 [Pyricularia grisea]